MAVATELEPSNLTSNWWCHRSNRMLSSTSMSSNRLDPPFPTSRLPPASNGDGKLRAGLLVPPHAKLDGSSVCGVAAMRAHGELALRAASSPSHLDAARPTGQPQKPLEHVTVEGCAAAVLANHQVAGKPDWDKLGLAPPGTTCQSAMGLARICGGAHQPRLPRCHHCHSLRMSGSEASPVEHGGRRRAASCDGARPPKGLGGQQGSVCRGSMAAGRPVWSRGRRGRRRREEEEGWWAHMGKIIFS